MGGHEILSFVQLRLCIYFQLHMNAGTDNNKKWWWWLAVNSEFIVLLESKPVYLKLKSWNCRKQNDIATTIWYLIMDLIPILGIDPYIWQVDIGQFVEKLLDVPIRFYKEIFIYVSAVSWFNDSHVTWLDTKGWT